MKSTQYQVDSERFIIYLSQYALRQGACDRREASIQGTQLPPTEVGGLRLRPPPTKSGQTVADSAKTVFTESAVMLIEFQTLNAPAKAGGFNQLMENKNADPRLEYPTLAGCRHYR